MIPDVINEIEIVLTQSSIYDAFFPQIFSR